MVPSTIIERNLQTIRSRIDEAARKSGRGADAIKLIAVTKYVGLAEIEALYALGVRDFGESRIQDATKKVRGLTPPTPPFQGGENKVPPLHENIRWHLIGHLQTNKAENAIELFHTVHSIDSTRVAQALDKAQAKAKSVATPLPCLIEVNVAGEANKYGLKPECAAIEEVLKVCTGLSKISIRGLMCMAPYAENPEPTSRPVFRRLRELLEEINAKQLYPQKLSELSMGMTQDYHIAIEEGATFVRIGSALFETGEL